MHIKYTKKKMNTAVLTIQGQPRKYMFGFKKQYERYL